MIWASSWENLFMSYANNKDADQPAHPRSLISVFVIRCLASIIPVFAIISFKTLASLCSWADWFESYLVENPKRQVFLWCGSYVMSWYKPDLHFVFGDVQSGKNQTDLLSYRSWLESWNFKYVFYRYYSIQSEHQRHWADCAGWSASLLFAYDIR